MYHRIFCSNVLFLAKVNINLALKCPMMSAKLPNVHFYFLSNFLCHSIVAVLQYRDADI